MADELVSLPAVRPRELRLVRDAVQGESGARAAPAAGHVVLDDDRAAELDLDN
ncbi:hypothetical protein [Pseudarthrobacter sp. Y6]|uniref:hypothetical protein n=1 Tax=Pseudarthrobacter sp. Y6 TaxID=3418422 RepID=UPI003CF8709F